MNQHPLLENRNRLVAECRAMQEKYGNRAILRSLDYKLEWAYTVHESGREFPIRIIYPVNYPSSPPQIVSVKDLPPSPHQLGKNKICWIDPWANDSDWNPARDTAAVCIPVASRWFACLLIYLTLGEWPEGAQD